MEHSDKERIKRSLLYAHYRQYCDQENVLPERNATFYAALAAQGFRQVTHRGVRMFGAQYMYDK